MIIFDGGQFVHFLLAPCQLLALAHSSITSNSTKLKQVWLPVHRARWYRGVVGAFSSVAMPDCWARKP